MRGFCALPLILVVAATVACGTGRDEAARSGTGSQASEGATHPDYPERSCVQWYARPGAIESIATARGGVRGDESPGRVVCDTP